MEAVKSIKLWDGIRITTASESMVCTNNEELWHTLNMEADEYNDLRTEIMKQLFCFGKCDLTPQYHGYMVMLTIVREEA